jgi:signal transduction histidine kinase/ActR/RegA family two-component response regulator
MPDTGIAPPPAGQEANRSAEALLRENEKLRRINRALMASAERGPDVNGSAFALFQTAAALGNQVQERTAALTKALAELTAVKEREAQARERLASAIEAINQGIVLCDADDRIVVANGRYRELWRGLPAEPGTAFADVVRGAVRRGIVAGGEDRPEGDGDGQCRPGGDWDGQDWEGFRLARHRDPGEPFVIEFTDGTWLQVSERRVAGGGTVSLYTDITEIKRDEARRRERELEEKSVLLQATLNNLSKGVSVFDSRGTLVACNAAFLSFLGVPAESFAGDLAGSDDDALAELCARLDAMGLTCVHRRPDLGHGWHQQEYRTPDGRTFEIRCSVMQGGYRVATFMDVTERLRISQALQEANEGLERRVEARTAELSRANAEILAAKAEAEMMNLSKTRFFAAANHDLLQPLAAARVFASALSERRLSAPNRELVRHALSALDSVDEMITALLDIAKLDAGVMPPAPCSFAISEVMLRVGEEYRLIAARQKLRLRVFAGAAVVQSDPRLVARILRNLVSNALRYTASGGVLIGHRRVAEGLLVGVWDTGIGIPQDQQEEIFEEFRRLPQASDHSFRGAGLGLSIVRRVSRMLGHRLVVRSIPGRGSLFGIVLPLSDTPPVSTQRPRSPAGAGAQLLRGRCVQLIDDEPHVLQGLSVLLTGWGMRARGAASAAQALEAEVSHGQDAAADGEDAGLPDLIIADYRLEAGTGVEAINTLRRRWGDLPAIIVTADHAPEVQQEVTGAGLYLLHKPVRPARLRSLITHVLQQVRVEA